MDSLGDLLKRKADDIDVEARKTELELMQEVLHRHFGDYAQAKKFHNGHLTVKVDSSAMASDVRMSQITLIEEFNRLPEIRVERLIIRQI